MISCMLQSKSVDFIYVFFILMLKSLQVVSELLMVSLGPSSWMGNPPSLWQMQIIFLFPHSVIITSSCMLTHVIVMMIPPNGLNLTFPIIAMWLLSPTSTHCLSTRSFGGCQPSLILAACHSMGPYPVYGNSVNKFTMNSGPLSFFSPIV